MKVRVVTRPLKWEDVDASISLVNEVPWVDANGDTRVYAKLRHASWVGITLWIRDPDLREPTTRVVIMLKLHKRLAALVERLCPLLLVELPVGTTGEQVGENKKQPALPRGEKVEDNCQQV